MLPDGRARRLLVLLASTLCSACGTGSVTSWIVDVEVLDQTGEDLVVVRCLYEGEGCEGCPLAVADGQAETLELQIGTWVGEPPDADEWCLLGRGETLDYVWSEPPAWPEQEHYREPEYRTSMDAVFTPEAGVPR